MANSIASDFCQLAMAARFAALETRRMATDRARERGQRIQVARKRKGLTLESHNAAPIRDVQIEWASEIVTVVRARQREKSLAIRKAVRRTK